MNQENKSEDDSEFWRVLQKIEKLLHIYGRNEKDTPNIKSRKITNSLKENDYIRDNLGILGATFGLADRSKNSFILLERPDYFSLGDKYPAINIPYKLRINQQSFSKIIDLLFLGRRREQHLYNNPPEFYNYLSDVDTPLELEFEEELRNKSGFKFLYCTAGEIYFFVLAWRWLIRYAQINDIEDEIHEESASELLSLKNGTVPDFWNPMFWKTIGEERTPEKSIIKNFEDLREDLKKNILEPEAQEFVKEAIIQWEKLIEKFDKINDSYYFFEELGAIGLIDTNSEKIKIKKEFLLLIEYCICLTKSKVFEKVEMYTELSKCKDEIYEVLKNENAPIELEEIIPDFIRVLQRIFFILLKNSNKRTDLPISFLLKQLHDISRFPIIPYFYMIAIANIPQEHLIIPVWESYKYPIEYKARDRYEIDIDYGEKPSKIETANSVVICLITIKPNDWSGKRGLSYYSDYYSRLKSSGLLRIYKTKTLFEKVATIIIDESFYGGLIEPRIFHSAADTFGHEIKHISIAISSRWLIPPKKNIKEKINELPIKQLWANKPWKIIPFPELLESAGKLFRLWSGTDNILDVFEENPPKTMKEMIKSAWHFAKDNIKPLAARRVNFNHDENDIIKAEKIINDVDQLWKNLFDVSGGDDIQFPDDRNESKILITNWINLFRLFISIFVNCIRHAAIEKKILANVEKTNSVIKISIKNYKSTKNSDVNIPEFIKAAREVHSTTPLLNKIRGIDIIKLYYLKIVNEGEGKGIDIDENANYYKISFEIPTKKLKGGYHD